MSRNDDPKAGKYELIALRWDEVLSKPGEPFDFTRHRKGDTVDLDVETARRLVRAGAVKPVAKAREADEPDAAPAKSASKADWVTYATADARGEEKLTEEEANDLTRDQLVEKYQG